MQEAIRHGGRAAGRPTRAQIEPAARELVQRHGAQILSTARRYSLTAEDAEDAYQRGLEILLVKAPSTREDDLVPWLKTVVKHEAFAIRRQRRGAELSGDPDLPGGLAPPTDEQAERHERLWLGAEAMSRLKPQEVRCLLLRAEGYSYKQICEETGWTYTKVNRCLAEGRKAFLERIAGIEAGEECERLAPRLSALAGGEATPEDMAALRPHLRSCLACRATLREYRGAPSRVAAPLPLLAAPHALGRLVRRAHGLLLRAHDSLQHAADLASPQKVAAVAAASAALAGGGVATVTLLDHDAHHPRHAQVRRPPHERIPAGPVARPAAKTVAHQAAHSAASRKRRATGARRVATHPVTATQQEFAPSPVGATAKRDSRATPAPTAATSEFGP